MKRNDAHLLPVPVTKRRKKISWLLAIVIFISGYIAGGGTTAIYIRHRVFSTIYHPEQAPKLIAKRLSWSLDLTPEQSVQIEKILYDRRLRLEELRRNVQPQFELELSSIEAEVSALLTDAQRKEWHKRFQKFRKRWIPPVPSDHHRNDLPLEK